MDPIIDSDDDEVEIVQVTQASAYQTRSRLKMVQPARKPSGRRPSRLGPGLSSLLLSHHGNAGLDLGMHDREESAMTGISIQECFLSPCGCRNHKFCCLPREFCWSARVLGVGAAAEGCIALAGRSPARQRRSVLASTTARRGRSGHP